MRTLLYFLTTTTLLASAHVATAQTKEDSHLRDQAKKVAQIIEYSGAWRHPKAAKDETDPEALYGTLTQKAYAWMQSRRRITPELLEVAIFTLNTDPSLSTGQVLLPVVEANPKAWKHSLEKLPTEQRKQLESNIEDTQREIHDGNG